MTRTGAPLAVHALEQLGIEHTFGIPGVHNTELYDAHRTAHDGELGQISQFQSIPLNRKVCTQLSEVKIEGVAEATGAHYVPMETGADIDPALDETESVAETDRPVIVDVNIDYRRRTQMTTGVVKTILSRFSTSEKVRFVARAAKRHLFG